MTDVYLAVEAALDDHAAKRIKARWEAVNPQLAGADVADILDMLCEADSDLDLIEGIPDWEWPDHAACGAAARAVIWGRPMGALRMLIPDELEALLARVEDTNGG